MPDEREPMENAAFADIATAPLDLPVDDQGSYKDQYRKALDRIDEAGTEIIALKDQISVLKDEKNNLKEENSKLRARADTSKVLNKLIHPMANKAFCFMCCYSGVVAFFLLLRGLSGAKFDLTDSVLQILVGSTAVTVIGLVGMVLTGVFVGARKND